MSAPQKIVVFGTGPVGLFVIKELIARGKHVKAVNRSGTLNPAQRAVLGLTSTEESLLQVAACDLNDAQAVIDASENAEALVHAANPPDYTTWARDLPVWQTHLIEAAVRRNVPLTLSENLYPYAADRMPMTETSTVAPRTKKGALRQRLHEQVITARNERGLRWVSVRASDFYGPGSTQQSQFGDRFMGPLFAGKTPAILGRTDQPHSYCYVGDFGKALATVLLEPSAHGRVWFAPHLPALTGSQMAERFFECFAETNQVKRPRNVARLSSGLIRVLGAFNPLLREVSEMMFEFDAPFTVDSSDFEKTFGLAATPLEDGVRASFEWYRSRLTR